MHPEELQVTATVFLGTVSLDNGSKIADIFDSMMQPVPWPNLEKGPMAVGS